MKKRIFVSTGEVSGDLQGSLLIEALHRQAAFLSIELEIVALGGDRMAASGAKLLGHTSEIGSMGIFESLPYLMPSLQIQRHAKQDLKQNPPDAVVLIDYMGPNIAFCNYLSKHLPKIPVVFYIAPQEWVWAINSYNTNCIVSGADLILAIFPEEANYFQRKGGKVTWVGHPLVDRLLTAPDRATARASLGLLPDQPIVTLLPASRQQELKYLMPTIFAAAQLIQAKIPDIQFLVPLALEKYRQPIEQALQKYGLQATLLADTVTKPEPSESVALQAIAAADLAISKSGTVNLETALLNVPQVVLYKLNPLTGWIAHRLLRFSAPYVSPPNLVQMKPIVKEFLQFQATPAAIAQESLDLLLNPQRRQQMLSDYAEMQQAVGAPGVCDRAAKEILALLP